MDTTALITAAAYVLLNLGLLATAAFGLSLAAGPRQPSGWIIAGCLSSMAVVAVVSELAGRFAYTPLSLTLGMAVAAVAGAILIWRERAAWPALRWPAIPGEGWPRRILAACLLIWTAAALWTLAAHVLTPPGAADALRYHAAAPAHWVVEGRLQEIAGADYRVNHFPHVMSLLWGWPLALTRTDFLSGAFPVMTVFAFWPAVIYLLARRCGARRDASLFFALFSAASATILIQGMNEGVDVLFWGASLLGLTLALSPGETFRRNWLAVGLATGLALGAKSYGAAAAPFILLIWLTRRILEARRADQGYGGLIGPAMATGLAALAVGGWVYGYNLWAYGNPLYPYPFFIDFGAASSQAEAFYDKAVLAGEAGSLQALWAVLTLTPALLLALPPLDNMTQAYSAGLGLAAPTLLAAIAVFALLRLRAAGPDQRGAINWRLAASLAGAGLVLNYILASQWGVQILNKATPDFSSLARYQLIWPAILAVAAACLTPPGPRLRTAALAVLALTFAGLTAHSLYYGQSRNWKTITRVAPLFPDRTQQAARVNATLTPPIAELLNDNPDANLLEIGSRGLLYPLFYPGFERQVYKSGFRSVDRNVLFNWAFDRDLYDLIDVREDRWRNVCFVTMVKQYPFFYGIDKRELKAHVYNSQIIHEQDVQFILVHDDEGDAALWREDLRFRLVEAYRNPVLGTSYVFRRRARDRLAAPDLIECIRAQDAMRAEARRERLEAAE